LSAEHTVRLATEADVEVIHGLLSQLAESTGLRHKFRSQVDDFRKHGFSGERQFEVLLAEQGNDVIGLCLFFYNFSSWRGQLGVYIQDLVVDKDVRARGIGRLLVGETARYARNNGATHLRLSVDTENQNAIRFYENLGLSESVDESIYSASGDDFLKLAKLP
jgi:ribosomal protein S18 acetylase RimI-like enzyme